VYVSPRRRQILFRELKTEKGRPTAEQLVWLDAITAAGGDAGIWRPSDVEVIESVLLRG
jgi:hypothetical protein